MSFIDNFWNDVRYWGTSLFLILGLILVAIVRMTKHKSKEVEEVKEDYEDLSRKELIALAKKKEKVAKQAHKTSKKVEVLVDNTRTFDITKVKSKFTYGYWQDWVKEKYFPTRVVLVNMELNNGFHTTRLVVEKEDGFVYRGKKYVFDDDKKYYNMDSKYYQYDYHESFVLPISRKIPVNLIKKKFEKDRDIDIEYSTNPATLQRFMTAKIAEGVMKGSAMDEFLRKLQMFIIVIMVVVLAHLALYLYASGILSQIKVPGT